MNTLIPVGAGATAPAPGSHAAASMWRDGAILQAIVRGRTTEGLTRLEIGRHMIDARGGRALQQGQRLDLKVVIGRDQVLLKPLGEQPTARIRDAVRHALPRQSGQPPLLANLGFLARSAPAAGRAPQLLDLARALLTSLPTRDTVVRPDGLRRAIRDSGVFLENRLTRDATSGDRPQLTGDWKAALLRASAALGRIVVPPAPAGAAPARSPTPGGTPTTGSSADASGVSAGKPSVGAAPVSRAPMNTATPPPAAVPAGQAAALDPARPLDGLPPRGALPGSGTAAAPADKPRAKPLATNPPGARAHADIAVRARDAAPPPMRSSAPAPQPPTTPSIAAMDARGAIAELTSQLGGVLARLTLSQLASLPTDAGASNAWLIELPVRNAQGDTDVFEFRFERESPASEERAAAWSVQLSFDFDSTGPVHARVTVRGDEVTTRFRARRESTSDLIAAQLDQLRDRFEERGLTVNCLACQTGEPPKPVTTPGGLVRTRA